MVNFRQTGLLLTTFAVSTAGVAQEMRCGNELISGDQMHPLIKAQVLEKCGEPTSMGQDRWYYEEQGKILVFNGNGELDHIEDANEEE